MLAAQQLSESSSPGSLVEIDATFASETPPATARSGRSPRKRPRSSQSIPGSGRKSVVSPEEEVLKQRVANILETYSKESSSVESTPAKKRCSRSKVNKQSAELLKTPAVVQKQSLSGGPFSSKSIVHPTLYRTKQEFTSVSPPINASAYSAVQWFSSPSVVSLSDSSNTHPESAESSEESVVVLEQDTPKRKLDCAKRTNKRVNKDGRVVKIELDGDSSEDSCDDLVDEESPTTKIKRENAFSSNFIGMIRTRPLLYDRKHADFYSKQARRKTYEQLGQLMQMKGWKVCQRWRKEIKDFEFLINQRRSRKSLEKMCLFRNMEWYTPYAHLEKDILMEDEMFDADYIAENEVHTSHRHFPIEKPRSGLEDGGPCSSSSCSTPRITVKEDLSSVSTYTLSSDDSKAYSPSEVEVLDPSSALGDSITSSLRTMKNKKRKR
uniref:MADF domain-containing protein n=1 Tax=Ditylenchus dipsaci TaxID=166011 RepID=A0A915DZ86_9BILA